MHIHREHVNLVVFIVNVAEPFEVHAVAPVFLLGVPYALDLHTDEFAAVDKSVIWRPGVQGFRDNQSK